MKRDPAGHDMQRQDDGKPVTRHTLRVDRMTARAGRGGGAA